MFWGIFGDTKYARISAMSGHSKWSTIKRAKGAADIKRGLTFTKMANAITIAVKAGGSGDPASNPRLRVAMEEAKVVNMPKENVARAIDRGLGRLPGQIIEEIVYEGFGPSKVAYLVEAVTDNKLRTLQEIKNLFERSGGSLAGTGAVSYMFESKGEIRVKGKGGDKDEEMLELIDLGAEDVEDFLEDNIQRYLVYVSSANLNEVSTKITQARYVVESSESILKPTVLVSIKDKETADKVIDFTSRLEEHDDIQKVYTNFEIAEGLI